MFFFRMAPCVDGERARQLANTLLGAKDGGRHHQARALVLMMASSIFGAEQRIGEPLSALAVLTGRHREKNTRDPVLVNRKRNQRNQRVNDIGNMVYYCNQQGVQAGSVSHRGTTCSSPQGRTHRVGYTTQIPRPGWGRRREIYDRLIKLQVMRR